MVRLLQDGLYALIEWTDMFQSHNGAIAALLRRKPTIGWLCFNPTMVRLLLGYRVQGAVAENCFNPTMVRLLRLAAM